MVQTMLSDFESPGNHYVAPWIAIFSFETEYALAKSNIEPIEDDDDEYGWD